MERYADATSTLKQNLPSILKPLTKVNYILGTFPYSISTNNGRVLLSSKSIHFYRAISTFTLISFTIIATIYRFVIVFKGPSSKSYDFNGGLGEGNIMAKIVELACAFYANCITLVILGLTFFNRKNLQCFFTGMENYALTLGSYIDPLSVMKRVRKLYILYGFLAIHSAVVSSARFYVNPYMGPISVLFEFLGIEEKVSPEVVAAVSGAFIFYIALAKFACLGFVEIVSCGLAKCMSRCMENIMEQLETEVESWGRQFKGIKSRIDKDDFNNILAATSSSGRSSASTNSTKMKFQNELEDYIEQIRELNPGLIATDVISPSPNVRNRSPKLPAGSQLLKTTPGKALSHAARSFSNVAAMQNVTNCVFGHTLAINIGCIVGMSVILKYLVIKDLMADIRAPRNMSFLQSPIATTLEPYLQTGAEGSFSTEMILNLDNDINGTFMALEDNQTLTDPSNGSSASQGHFKGPVDNWNPYGLDSLEWLMFLFLDLSMFVRLGVVVISLGKVHKTSLKFNSVMSKSFLAANKLIEEITEALQLSGNASSGDIDEYTKGLLTPTQMSSIGAFMNLYSANPVAFTAGGLFVFSSGLLLMIVSIIISYLVFLLQA